jgi:uncharacterized membrane protein
MTVWQRFKTVQQRPQKSVVADVILLALVGGPLAAPFLASTSLPLLPLIANIIYFMGDRVCPQPEMGLALSPPHIMAVCMRCYGTLLGLVAMRWLISRSTGREAYWLNQYGFTGFCVTLLLCLAYPAELWAQYWGWWGYNNTVVTAFGWVAGLGLGAYIMPLLYSSPINRFVRD